MSKTPSLWVALRASRRGPPHSTARYARDCCRDCSLLLNYCWIHCWIETHHPLGVPDDVFNIPAVYSTQHTQ